MKFLPLLFTLHALSAAINVGTYNIRNFDPHRRHKATDLEQLKGSLQELNVDVLAIQEIHEKEEFKLFIKKNLPQYRVTLTKCGGSFRQHLGFIYHSKKLKLTSKIENREISRTSENSSPTCNRGVRPALMATFKIRKSKKKFTLINLHLKAGSSQSDQRKRSYQLETLSTEIDKYFKDNNQKFIVMGDFNTTEFNAKSGSKSFDTFQARHDLKSQIDRYQCSAYWSGRGKPKMQSSLLDHILVDQRIQIYKTKTFGHCEVHQCQEVSYYRINDHYKEVSDHCAKTMEVEI